MWYCRTKSSIASTKFSIASLEFVLSRKCGIASTKHSVASTEFALPALHLALQMHNLVLSVLGPVFYIYSDPLGHEVLQEFRSCYKHCETRGLQQDRISCFVPGYTTLTFPDVTRECTR